MKHNIRILPNTVTAFGLCCGLFIIFNTILYDPKEGLLAYVNLSAIILILAAFADLLDGTIARAIKAESDFGGLFDSMSDAITFGVAPSVVVLKTLQLPAESEFSFLLMAAAIVFSLCGVLRLVRFNILATQAHESAELLASHKKNFTGLPIPAAAAALISSNLFLLSPELRYFVEPSPKTIAWILFAQMLTLGYFMVSRWKFPSFKTLQLKIYSFSRVFVMVVVTVFTLFYAVFHHFSAVFFILSWGYLMVGWTLSILRIVAGRKSKTLEDFEPEPEEEIELHG